MLTAGGGIPKGRGDHEAVDNISGYRRVLQRIMNSLKAAETEAVTTTPAVKSYGQ